jgi:hypothetical protein
VQRGGEELEGKFAVPDCLPFFFKTRQTKMQPEKNNLLEGLSWKAGSHPACQKVLWKVYL